MTSRTRVSAWTLPAIHLTALAFFFALDLSDFYFKTAWLGPFEATEFHALGTATFDRLPLVPSANTSALDVGDEVNFTSGWPSLLAKCDALYGANVNSDSDLFLLARATNCVLGAPTKQFLANDLFLVASARVDAVAWTACKLLYLHRRPPLCQENVVTEFVHRYRLSDPVIAADAMADINSDAERELLEMLALISQSYPLSSVVCVEAVQYGGTGEYPAPTLVGCGSPNVFDAAFVGVHAPAFTALHYDKAYLTVDVLNLMGFEFVIRQNSQSSFHLRTTDHDGSITLDHRTAINFSSFGHLYILVIAVDMALLAAHARSAMETASVLLLPMLGTQNADDFARLTHEYSWTIFYRSLYRSPPIVVLTLVSGLLSWQFQMPNAIIWTWNEQSSGKFHAVLACFRVWMIVHCVINQLWAVVVTVSETRAYAIAKRTFLSTSQVLMIGVVVAIANFHQTFAVGGAKYAVDGQRLWDYASFPGHTAYANSFNEELDYLLCTSTEVLGILYAPLATIVGEALLVAVGVVGAKYVYYGVRRRTDSLVDHDGDSEGTNVSTYQRLPLEELLCEPVRAQSLVRTTFPLELVAQHQQLYIPPSIYFDFGVILDNDIIRTRRGFPNVIHLKVDVAKYFSPVGGCSKSSVTSVASVAAVATVGLRRGTSFFGVETESRSFSRATATGSPLPRPSSSKAILHAVAATDSVRVASSSTISADTDVQDDSAASASASETASASATGRRPLAETAGSPASRSMRRRKSTNELSVLDDGF